MPREAHLKLFLKLKYFSRTPVCTLINDTEFVTFKTVVTEIKLESFQQEASFLDFLGIARYPLCIFLQIEVQKWTNVTYDLHAYKS